MAEAMTNLRGAEGRALAFETIELMAAHDVPVTAANYEVWLAHKIGARPDLSREIEARIGRGESFSDDLNDELFERFFANTRLSIQMVETSESIARELAEVVTTLRDAGSLTGSYADALQTAAASIEGELDATNLRAVVAHLAVSTREMANSNRQLLSADGTVVAAGGYAANSASDGEDRSADRRPYWARQSQAVR